MTDPNLSPRKINRKIWYLRSMNKPNVEGGATSKSWRAFWYMVFSLKLATREHKKYMSAFFY